MSSINTLISSFINFFYGKEIQREVEESLIDPNMDSISDGKGGFRFDALALTIFQKYNWKNDCFAEEKKSAILTGITKHYAKKRKNLTSLFKDFVRNKPNHTKDEILLAAKSTISGFTRYFTTVEIENRVKSELDSLKKTVIENRVMTPDEKKNEISRITGKDRLSLEDMLEVESPKFKQFEFGRIVELKDLV
jgi:hypothetical protein